jgi:hypothetical protein
VPPEKRGGLKVAARKAPKRPETVKPAGDADRRAEAVARPVVGWREWVALPRLGVKAVKAKVDTGARTSALHAFNVRPFRKDGRDWVSFEIHPLQRNDAAIKTCEAEAVDYRWVTNSGGGREKRFVIVTELRLGAQSWPIEMTLTDRDQMGFRMLLGRTAMERRLTVDPARSYCFGKPKIKKKIKKRMRFAAPAPHALRAAIEKE